MTKKIVAFLFAFQLLPDVCAFGNIENYKNVAPGTSYSREMTCKNLSIQEDRKGVRMVCSKKPLPVLVNPNCKNESFDFILNENYKIASTNWRKKNTSASIFLDLSGSDFKNLGVVSVSIFGKGPRGEINCTNNADFYLLEAGKKYELYNSVKENGCQKVQIRFKGSQGQRICGKWGTDYKPESDVLKVGGKTYPDSVKNSEFSLVISPNKTCCTAVRTKINDSSIFLELSDPNGRGSSIKCSVLGFGNSLESKNCTYKRDFYVLPFGQKYELFNTVKENKCLGVQLKFEGEPGTEIKGKWNPNYVTETDCIRIPMSPVSEVSFDSKLPDSLAKCEVKNIAITVRLYGNNVLGENLKNLVDDLVNSMNMKSKVMGNSTSKDEYNHLISHVVKGMEWFLKRISKDGYVKTKSKNKSSGAPFNIPLSTWNKIDEEIEFLHNTLMSRLTSQSEIILNSAKCDMVGNT
ncbi:MAG: hypothetical protein CfP315_0890 [Candidatus Improbicoccus pseudotrichonymphae]|uniref:Uncharacterized protein n=1 Tax=Candidatus Improbicoccus pseudotrichonymphae TaxID=3033792 RepID=A0AA48KVT6_9FIRM|nr:MAG: hypothetical protein CfP315_0890 [Candidatus Improbicoccus pseudotrichonymphae]